jgi:hypothetical protein
MVLFVMPFIFLQIEHCIFRSCSMSRTLLLSFNWWIVVVGEIWLLVCHASRQQSLHHGKTFGCRRSFKNHDLFRGIAQCSSKKSIGLYCSLPRKRSATETITNCCLVNTPDFFQQKEKSIWMLLSNLFLLVIRNLTN